MTQDRGALLRSLKRYLVDLAESGVEELPYADLAATEPADPATDPDFRLDGAPRARLLFVMAGSGFDGASGELLEKIVAAMGFSRQEVALLSFTPELPGAEENWRRSLAERIASVGPEVLVALGEESVWLMLPGAQPLDRLRGRFHDWCGLPVMPSFHPDAMLADPALKRDVWNDMQQVMRRLAAPL